jgi:hypothetical protein
MLEENKKGDGGELEREKERTFNIRYLLYPTSGLNK